VSERQNQTIDNVGRFTVKEGRATPLTGAELLVQQEVDRRFCEAMSRKDVDQVMSGVWDSPDMTFVDFEGNVFRGPDNFRKVVEGMFAQCESLRLVIDEISHVRVGDAVFAVGTATYDMQAQDGTSQQIRERWTDVRIQVDGRWVMAMDHIHLLPPLSP
jgi:uncharacterized protein (TIGR02246 family)